MENETVENETVETATVHDPVEVEAEDEAAVVSSEPRFDIQPESNVESGTPEFLDETKSEAETEERDDVLKSEPNPAEVKRERKNSLSAAVKDPVKEEPVDELATDEEPPVYDPASAKRERKDALPSANVDPVEEKSEPLTAVTIVHQSRDQYDVNSIVADAPDGAVVKCRDENDMYGIFLAAAKAGKTFKVAHRPNQEVRMRWQIPGSR